MTLTARQVSDLLTTHGLRPSRALGQNFVIDPNTVRRIVRLAETGPGDRVVEIGPGLGSLTVALADAGARVTAVEIDARLIPVLKAVLGALPVQVVQGDALRLDWADLLGPDPGWVVVANLPYNIATPLIATLLDDVPVVERLVIMVQREVADRLVALPGHREYGAVSVKVAYWAEASVVAHVPPTVFVPRPKVESALVSIRRRPVPAVDPSRVDPELLFRLVRAGFAKRRKMLRRSLAGLASPAAFETAEVRPDSRAENLDVYAWGRLAAAVAAAAEPGSGSGSGSGSPDPGSAAAGPGRGRVRVRQTRARRRRIRVRGRADGCRVGRSRSGSGSGSPDPGSAAADPGSGSGPTGADPGSGSGPTGADPGSAAARSGFGSRRRRSGRWRRIGVRGWRRPFGQPGVRRRSRSVPPFRSRSVRGLRSPAACRHTRRARQDTRSRPRPPRAVGPGEGGGSRRPGQADALAAGDRRASGRLPPARGRDGHPRPGRPPGVPAGPGTGDPGGRGGPRACGVRQPGDPGPRRHRPAGGRAPVEAHSCGGGPGWRVGRCCRRPALGRHR